jgi:hypothetical protein
MKKVIILLIVLFALFACEKPKEEETVDSNKGTVTFWTTEYSIDTQNCHGWFLWVDGVNIGVIAKPYEISTADQIPTCDDMYFTRLFLDSGTHSYYMTLSIPIQPPPNYFVSQTYYFDIVAGGCTIVRCTQ